jgi:hypothetical protein
LRDETGHPTTLQSIGNSRNTLGMFGSGYIEMLARQITRKLQTLRDGLAPGQRVALAAYGIDFGSLARRPDGAWDTSGLEGLPPPSVKSSGPLDPPSLLILPFHQAGAAVSLRQFTNTALSGSAEHALRTGLRGIRRREWPIPENEPPYFHRGHFTTLREAIEAHAGEAAPAMAAYRALSGPERDAIIDFLKMLRVLEPGGRDGVVDENARKRAWRKFPYDDVRMAK